MQEADRLREQLNAMSAEHEQSIRQHSHSGAQHESVASELRSEVKMRTFELTTLGVTHEARMTELRAANLKVEVLQKQVDAHVSEFRRLEESSKAKEYELTKANDEQRRVIEMYEGLELELDSAVLRAAGSNEGTDENEAMKRLLANDANSIGLAATSKSQKRVRQAVHLAKQLLEKERKLKGAESKLQSVEADRAKLAKRVKQLEYQITTVDHPSRSVGRQEGRKTGRHDMA